MSTQTLYTLSNPPDSAASLASTLANMDLGAGNLLLRQDACYLLANSNLSAALNESLQATDVKLYVVADDARARGLGDFLSSKQIQAITYPEWVELCLSHQQIQAW